MVEALLKVGSTSIGTKNAMGRTPIQIAAQSCQFQNLELLIPMLLRAVVVVKWSACSPSTPIIQVRIPLMPAVFSVNFVFEKIKNKQKRGRGWPI